MILIAGTVSESAIDFFPEGTRAAIILERGPPVRAGFMSEDEDAPSATCLAFLEGDIDGEAAAGLRPIEGTIELRP